MDIDFDKEMVGTVEVEERDKLDRDALTAWFEANAEGFAGPISYTKFKGGQSHPTYKIETPSTNYVLRRQPFGKLLPSAHAVDREYAAMTGLHPTGFPVPKTYGVCEDPDVIGSKFFVMSMADGRSLWNGSLPGMEPDERRALYNALIDTIADSIERDEIERLALDRDDEQAILDRNIFGRLEEILVGEDAISGPKGFAKGPVTKEVLADTQRGLWWKIAIGDDAKMAEIEAI